MRHLIPHAPSLMTAPTRLFPSVGLIGLSLLACATAMAQGKQGNPPEFSGCQSRWLQEARQAGLNPEEVEPIIAQLEHLPKIIELDRRQPEFTSTFASYIGRRLTESRIDNGRRLYQEHADLLQKLSREYGVPGQYLTAFWGLETNYGGYLGNTSTLDALATLGCDPRRSGYFSAELIKALSLVEQHELKPARMQGSWAGAMGQTQFMPSNYARYGRDGDGDGRVDLWGSVEDALTSAAYFLQQLGWQEEERWGREVRLPSGFDYSLAGLDKAQALSEWAALGLRHANGGPLPVAAMDAALLVPAGHRGPAFLVYDNFRVIMRWNRSEFYALSVGMLADRIRGGGPLQQPIPEDDRRISRAAIKALQAALNARGFDAGTPDGILGPGTRGAISRFQSSRGLIADGYHSPEVFEALGIDSQMSAAPASPPRS